MLPSSPAADHPFFALPHQHQRDRAWSLFGPALLKADWSPVTLPWLNDDLMTEYWQALAELPKPAFSSTRLGLMFEQLWQQSLPLWCDRLQSNLQITSAQRTLGELDLLLSHSEQQWHAELALKFYLARGDDWIGPNSRDRLYRKLGHTRDQQLQLSATPPAQQQLQQSGWQRLQPTAIMRGCLFYCAADPSTSGLPAELNPQHWRGHWCYSHQLNALLPDGEWSLLAKDQWMSPARLNTAVDRRTLINYAGRHFTDLSYPLCAVKLSHGPYGLCEQQRWMIMPDQWPGEGIHQRLQTKPQN